MINEIPLERIQELILLKDDEDKFKEKIFEFAKQYDSKYVKILKQYQEFTDTEKVIIPEKTIKISGKIIVPNQLNKENIKFCRVQRGKKKPFEKNWTNKPYSFTEIQDFLDKENYGIICGYGGIAVIDCDNEELSDLIKKEFPETFTVKTGGGGFHFYYLIPELKKKLILDKDRGHENHLGEVQSHGAQVVGPGSLHPNGNFYEVINYKEIQSISIEFLYEKLGQFTREIKDSINSAEMEKETNEEIDDLNITSIWSTSGMKKQGDEYYGAHPMHGSSGGMNFWINPSKNIWHCFRCLCSNSKIITPTGIKNIQDLKKGDEVYGKNFQKNLITNNFSRIAKEKIYTLSTYTPPINLTENHPLYIGSIKYKRKHLFKGNPTFSWKKVSEINPKKDFLVIPKKHKSYLHKINGFNLDKNFGKLLGWYLAEGHLIKRKNRPNSTCIQLTLGLKSAGENVAKNLCNLAKKVGCDAKFYKYPNRGTILVSIYSKKLYDFIKKYIGTGSSKKHIGNLIQSPMVFLKSMVFNYIEADGEYSINKKLRRISSVSEELIREVQVILFKLGIPARYYYLSQKNNPTAKNPLHLLQWTINPLHKSEFQDSKNLYLPIKLKRIKSNKKVYNIETEDHIFLLPFISHNCNSGGGPLSAIAVQHGIIECGNSRAGMLRGDKAKEAIKIAQEKYGLKINYEKSSNFILLKKFSPRPFAEEIMTKDYFIYDKFKRFWRYNQSQGIWTDDAEMYLRSILTKHIFSDELQQKKYVEEVVDYIRRMSWKEDRIKQPPLSIIPFENTLYDLSTDKFLNFSHKYFIISKIPVKIDKELKDYSLIDKFMEDLLGPDKNKLYELMAYSLYRDYPYQKFFILYGEGKNGKSAFLRLLETILGGHNVSCVKPQDLINDRFASVNLFGKLANISPDIPYTELNDSTLIRELTGDDDIRGQFKHKDSFNFKNHAKIIFSANELPQVKDKNYAFDRRLYIIMFCNRIQNPDPDIIRKIATPEQLSGLMNYLLEVLKELYKKGFRFSYDPEVIDVSKLYCELSNSLAKFLKEHTKKEETCAIADWRMKQKFKNYCDQRGLRQWKVTEINEYMRNNYKETNISDTFFDTDDNGQKIIKETRVRAWKGLKFIN